MGTQVDRETRNSFFVQPFFTDRILCMAWDVSASDFVECNFAFVDKTKSQDGSSFQG